MVRSYTERKRIRKSFNRTEEILPPPSLIMLQKTSYDAFLQINVNQKKRTLSGLNEVLQSIFPISDNGGRADVLFKSYHFEDPESDETECLKRGISYAAALKVTFSLVVWDRDEETGERSIKDIKEQDVYMGDVPVMTDRGTFIINGIERVIVSQMHRSPGVFFDHDQGKTNSSGKYLYAARVIPYRGSWLDFEFDARDVIYVRIDRRKKMLLSTFLMALDNDETAELRKTGAKIEPCDAIGLSVEEILRSFYEVETFVKTKDGYVCDFIPSHWKGIRLERALVNADTGEVLAGAETKLTPRMLNKISQTGLKKVLLPRDALCGKYLVRDYIDEDTGEIFIEAGTCINLEVLEFLEDLGITEIETVYTDAQNVEPYMIQTLHADRCCNRDEALIEICRIMRPGEPPSVEGGEYILNTLFFDSDRYDLSAVGRVKMNARLGLSIPDTVRVLQKDDILRIVKTLLDLRNGKGEVDDIDNLGNRRVRSVGELLENQFRMGLLRMERTIKERLTSLDVDNAMPHDLINAKPLVSTMREFFGSSQLSQFMDQTNPLSEITHKRRLSALGPGGLSRDRAGFEVRDVHPTHYGRICPIETPEGPNIGLINSLATYASINKYGFIETPYRKVVDGKVTDEIVSLTAMEESKQVIAQATDPVDKNGVFVEEFVTCRKNGEYGVFPRSEITLVDVSPKQLVSVAAALIPFLENDDASRALMGSNMQRQAVPLLRNKAPLVGTGMEGVVAKDSGAVIVAKRPGVVQQVDGNRIVIHVDAQAAKKEGGVGVDIYHLVKFQGSNMSTCLNQVPIVNRGDVVKAGDIIADGPCTEKGELALGRNVKVAFMSWQGYNFEDSILISEKIVQDDVFTSIHIDGFEIMARDTKLGNEEITRDLPNVSEDFLRNLDETGIVSIGTEVVPGDILVGKVTPKNETPATPEEKLLRAIFGEKASDVRDSSLRVPPGVSGTVVEVRILSRRGVEQDERMLAIERQEIASMASTRDAEQEILEKGFLQHMRNFLKDQKIIKGAHSGQIATEELLKSLSRRQLEDLVVEDTETMKTIAALREQLNDRCQRLQKIFEGRVERLRRGDELPPGVLKLVKVFIASKRKLQPGDKMAGRHGNKGVVSRILPIEDMPYMEDGTPMDIILNPLGVPSRMNVGQILETHLGAAADGLGKQIDAALQKYREKQIDLSELRQTIESCYEKPADKKDIEKLSQAELEELAENLRLGVPMATPVFDGASLSDIEAQLIKGGLHTSGQVQLYDGRTGEPFDRKTTVGQVYMLKLHHLVDDKIHARSIGPYSLVTQQPLGGKAQFGGQRFGEMEVWALEAYGASYTLQEMLTVKSDDVFGRIKVYEGIVRGEEQTEAGIPESFNVLVKELRSLGLNIEFLQESNTGS